MAELNKTFIDELFKAAITNRATLDSLIMHMEFENLPTEAYKIMWREIRNFYALEEKLPTIGILNQRIDSLSEKEAKLDCRHILANVKKVKVENVHEELLKDFEKYKREVEFVSLYKKVSDIYNRNPEEAITMMARESERINNFNIKDGTYDRVFSDFHARQKERLAKDPDTLTDRIPSGIHELDHYIRGGWKKGTSFLALARSGSGKSTFLRSCAITAARLGLKVILFSLEGLREETLEALDSAWTSTPLEDMEFGRLQAHKVKKIEKTLQGLIQNGGEIYVHNNEKFDSMTIEQAYATTQEIIKLYGPVDMILFDYLEIVEAEGLNGRDSAGERRRREKISKKITDMAVEFKCVTGTATQTNDIAPTAYNNPDFVLTRTNISEFKGAIKPFSYFITFNQTDDEMEQNVCRIYCDKFRKHRAGQTIHIFQKLDIGRFYDSNKTLKYMWDKEMQKKKRLSEGQDESDRTRT